MKKTTARKTAAKKTTAKKKTTTTKAKTHVTVSHKPVVKKRTWSPDEQVGMCSARAVAQSLELALGVAVSHDDVLALYWLVADDADAGASILATLDAVERARGFEPLRLLTRCTEVSAHLAPAATPTTPLILGLQLPEGPHAVVQHDGIWWSWGEPYMPMDFPGAVIEEAWQVTWA